MTRSTTPAPRPEPQPPRVRASHRDRETIASQLSWAFQDGQLVLAEYDERVQQAWAATFCDELVPLVGDLRLPAESGAAQGASAVEQHHAPAAEPATAPAGRGSALSLGLLGGVDRSGGWHIAARHRALAVLGGVNLDLRAAQLHQRTCTISIAAVLGGVQIIVPEDFCVVSQAVGILGGVEVSDHRSASRPMPAEHEAAAVVKLQGSAVLGGISVVRAAPDAKVS